MGKGDEVEEKCQMDEREPTFRVPGVCVETRCGLLGDAQSCVHRRLAASIIADKSGAKGPVTGAILGLCVPNGARLTMHL